METVPPGHSQNVKHLWFFPLATLNTPSEYFYHYENTPIQKNYIENFTTKTSKTFR